MLSIVSSVVVRDVVGIRTLAVVTCSKCCGFSPCSRCCDFCECSKCCGYYDFIVFVAYIVDIASLMVTVNVEYQE